MDTETNGPRIVVSLSVLTLLSMATLVLRFYAGAKQPTKLACEDALLCASWVFLLLYFALTAAAVKYGLGHHDDIIPRQNVGMVFRLLYAGRPFGILAPALAKTCFAVLLLPHTRGKWQRGLAWLMLASVNLVAGVCAFALFFQCAPVNKAWDADAAGSCWNPESVTGVEVAAGAYSAAMDFGFVLLAVFLMWHLPLEREDKLGAAVLVFIGVFAGISGALASHSLAATTSSDDFAFASADGFVWSATETALTIMAVSLLALRSLLQGVLQQVVAMLLWRNDNGRDKGNNLRLERKYQNSDEEWMGGDGGLDRATRRGRIVVQDGKATVAYS